MEITDIAKKHKDIHVACLSLLLLSKLQVQINWIWYNMNSFTFSFTLAKHTTSVVLIHIVIIMFYGGDLPVKDIKEFHSDSLVLGQLIPGPWGEQQGL